MTLLQKFLKDTTPELSERNVRLQAIGRLTELPHGCQRQLQKSIETTAANTGLTLVLALSYGARIEMIDAIKNIVREVQSGQIDPAAIDAELFSRHLYTRCYPDPDLLIRTSGEMRLSNFLLWQMSYTEIYFTKTFGLISAKKIYLKQSAITVIVSADTAPCRKGLSFAAPQPHANYRHRRSRAGFSGMGAHQLETPTTRVLTASRTDEAYKIYFAEDADLLITETHLQPFSGLELLARLRQKDPNAMVVLTSAFGTTQSVIESMKLGAYDFIRKESLPFNLKWWSMRRSRRSPKCARRRPSSRSSPSSSIRTASSANRRRCSRFSR